jgi:TM2 domain-containing membrane protein YozV
VSDKSRLVAVLLCFFLGWVGAHRFYVGKIGTGVLMVLTLGGVGLWTLADLVMVSCGVFRDKQGRRIFRWFEEGSI